MSLEKALAAKISEYVKPIISLDQDRTVTEAAKLMREKAIGSVVVTVSGDPVGIVTERDVLYRVVAVGKDPSRTSLAEVMSKPLHAIAENTTVAEAIAEMARLGVRRLLVKDQNRIIGIVSQRQVAGSSAEAVAVLPELELARGVRCPYCNSIFDDKAQLSKHIDRIHIGAGLLQGDLRKWKE